MAESEDAGSLETRKDAGKGDKGLVRLWLSAIDLADKKEEKWRKKATEVTKIYRATDDETKKKIRFNILHSNTATLRPAIYNSTPVPDVRRRFRDKDEAGKIAAQVLERGLSYSVDSYDFDAVMKGITHDSVLAGRGVPRLRYVPIMGPVDDARSENDEHQSLGSIAGASGMDAAGDAGDGGGPSDASPTNAEQAPTEEVLWESVECEIVDWRDFRVGPGRRWEEVPWVAIRHRLTRDQLSEKFGRVGATMNLDFVTDGVADKDIDKKNVEEVFKRGTVWEIWDKEKRKILFIAPAYKDAPLKQEDDTLGLEGFFPTPRPLYDVFDPNDTVPVVPFALYESQVDDLETLTERISKLTAILKWRGVRADAGEFPDLSEAEDGDLLPIQNWQQFAANGGLDKAFWLMPIDQVIVIVKELYLAREQVKQTIFEITGVADIMRGETDPNETLGAQRIKAQWGTLRLQDRQNDVQRIARDIYRMKAEIIAEKFSIDTIKLMSGIDLPMQAEKDAIRAQIVAAQQQAQQAAVMHQQMPPGMPVAPPPPQIPPEIQERMALPSWEDIKALLESDSTRGYRIDIETASTIEADQVIVQENMSKFVEGSAAYFGAIGEAVKGGAFPMDVAIDIYAGFARQFKLGKTVEDALDRLSQNAQTMAKQPKTDPNAAANAEAQAKAQADAAKVQSDQQIAAAKISSDEKIALAELQQKDAAHAREMQHKAMMAEADRTMQDQQHARQTEASAKPTTMVQLDAQGAIQEVADGLKSLAGDQSAALVQAVNTLAEMSSGFQQAMMALSASIEKMNLPRETVLHKRGGQKIAISRPVMQ